MFVGWVWCVGWVTYLAYPPYLPYPASYIRSILDPIRQRIS